MAFQRPMRSAHTPTNHREIATCDQLAIVVGQFRPHWDDPWTEAGRQDEFPAAARRGLSRRKNRRPQVVALRTCLHNCGI